LRHDFALVLENQLSTEVIQAICEDLLEMGFRTDFESISDEKTKEIEEHVVLFALDDDSKLFEEAEKQRVCHDYNYLKKAKKDQINELMRKNEEAKGID
jgi:hypothetical protein